MIKICFVSPPPPITSSVTNQREANCPSLDQHTVHIFIFLNWRNVKMKMSGGGWSSCVQSSLSLRKE